ncbi:MAG: aminodeoxychorismate synthase component I [Bacteroidales bacterium]
MDVLQAISYLNDLGKAQQKCFFIIDFAMHNIEVWELPHIPHDIAFHFPNCSVNTEMCQPQTGVPLQFSSHPVLFEEYKNMFSAAQYHIRRGDTFLLNLTASTPIESSWQLYDIFSYAKAPYKLFYKNEFVVFSPEPFISMYNNKIYTFPMKGTIDASEYDAVNTLLNNEKERAEHATIVDLLRNDMSMVAHNVQVNKYRYVEKISSLSHTILQASSCIEGTVHADLQHKIGTVLFSMLPAGSVSGAPKAKTVDIITDIEHHNRGYYTGVMGYFDGSQLNTAVMIRFIENNNGNMLYKSGGGITFQSDAMSEYTELIKKIYVPVGN